MSKRIDLTIRKGTDFRLFLGTTDDTGQPVNVAGYNLRVRLADGATHLLTLQVGSGVTILSPYKVSTEGETFQFQIDLTNAQTQALPAKNISIEATLIEPSGRLVPYFQGVVVVTPSLPAAT